MMIKIMKSKECYPPNTDIKLDFTRIPMLFKSSEKRFLPLRLIELLIRRYFPAYKDSFKKPLTEISILYRIIHLGTDFLGGEKC